MKWFGRKPEERQSSGVYTDAVIAAIQAQARGVRIDPGATAAVEIAAGTLGRAMAAARIENGGLAAEALSAPILNSMARDLIRRGDSVWLIEVDDRGPILTPAASWDISGGSRRSKWFYRLDIFGPDKNRTEHAQAENVIHLQWSHDPETPWLGIGPLQRSLLTADGLAQSEAALRDEAAGPRGSLIPVADMIGDKEGDENPVSALTALIAGLKGRAALVETQTAGAGVGPSLAPQREWTANRLGFDAPASLNTLASDSARSVLAACGVPIELLTGAEGTASREALRRFLHGTVKPVGNILQKEFRGKLDEPSLVLNFDELFASDLAGRARAFQSMVGGGMETEKAAALAGLMAKEEN